MSGIHQILAAISSGGKIAVYNGTNTVLVPVNSTFGACCALTDSKFVIVYTYTPGATVYAVVATISAGVITVGTPAAISASAGAPNIVFLTSTSALVTFATTVQRAVVLSITGTTITVNTAVTVDPAGTSGQAKIDAFTSTLVGFSHNVATGGITSAVLSISGVTITVGTLLFVANTGNVELVALDSTSLLLQYRDTAALAYRGVVYTRSGTTLTANTVYTIANYRHKITKLSATQVVGMYGVAGVLYASLITIAGTVVSEGVGTSIDATAGADIGIWGAQIDSNRVLCAHGNSPVVRILGSNGSTVSGGPSSVLPTFTVVGLAVLSVYRGVVIIYDGSANNTAALVDIY